MIRQPTHTAGLKCFERSGNRRTFLCQPHSAFGTSDGSWVTRWRSPCAPKAFSSTRVLPVSHRARQSSIDCLNDVSVISCSRCSANSFETWQRLLRRGHCARRLGNLGRTRRFVHPAGCWYEAVAAAITHQELQAVDANCVGAVVGRPVVGRGNLRPLVHSPHSPEVTKSPIT